MLLDRRTLEKNRNDAPGPLTHRSDFSSADHAPACQPYYSNVDNVIIVCITRLLDVVRGPFMPRSNARMPTCTLVPVWPSVMEKGSDDGVPTGFAAIVYLGGGAATPHNYTPRTTVVVPRIPYNDDVYNIDRTEDL